MLGNQCRKSESDGHPIIGHYVVGAVGLEDSIDRLPPYRSVEVAPLNVMTIIVRPLIGSPLCARYARRLAHSHDCYANVPAGDWRDFSDILISNEMFLGQNEIAFAAEGRQGSSLRCDKFGEIMRFPHP